MSVTAQDIKEGRINDELETQLEAISAKVEAGMEKGRNAWADFREDAQERCRQVATTANDYVRESPWQAVGMAAGLGLIVGLLCARR